MLDYLEGNVKNPVKLNIVDIILINPNTMHVNKWIYTDSEGYIKFQTLNSFPFSQMAKSLLADLSPTQLVLAEHRRIVHQYTNYIGNS